MPWQTTGNPVFSVGNRQNQKLSSSNLKKAEIEYMCISRYINLLAVMASFVPLSILIKAETIHLATKLNIIVPLKPPKHTHPTMHSVTGHVAGETL